MKIKNRWADEHGKKTLLPFSKKAMSAGFLVSVIIVILSFMLIAGTIARFFADADEKEAEELCRNSVVLRAAATVSVAGGLAEARLSPLLCKTINKEISEDRKEVQKIIADKMAKCWDMFGAGAYKTSTFENTNLFGHENNCFVCYVIPIEKISDDEGNTKISSVQFEDFMARNKIKGTDYLSYIQSKSGGQGYVTTALASEGITEKRVYGIIYVGKKEDCGGECTGTLVGGVATAVVGGIATVITGGGALPFVLLVGGAGVAAAATDQKIHDFTSRWKRQIDGILLADLSDPAIRNALFRECNYIPDIAGK